MLSADNKKEHYKEGEKIFIHGRVIDKVQAKSTYHIVRVHVSKVFVNSFSYSTKENFQVFIKKSKVTPLFTPGDCYVFYGTISEIKNRGNPGEFDYRSYMHRRNFRYNLFINNTPSYRYFSGKKKLKYIPLKIRDRIQSAWDMTNRDFAVLSALTLGDKSFLSDDTKDFFSSAGAMHLLAVSGLHVGMVWWILDLLIRIPNRFKYWKLLKMLIILGILWFYAAITGFSESVTRSVTMFSLVSFSKAIFRNSNIFNTIFVSLFLLIILKPERILEPGFQLSYTAVIGIISIQPLLSKYYSNYNIILKRFMDLISVSLSAQLATLPLVLYYFNQFPLWFLLTNLFAIPIVSLILALFVLFSPFLISMPSYSLFSQILEKFAHFLNIGVETISSLPNAVIDSIPMKALSCISSLITLSVFIIFLKYKDVKILLLGLSFAVLTILISSFYSHKSYLEESIEIYNYNSTTIISSKNKSQRTTFYISENDSLNSYEEDFLNSLIRIPVKLKRHFLVDLKETNIENKINIFNNLNTYWSINAQNQDILIIGKCSSLSLERLLSGHEWDIIIFRTGFPIYTDIEELEIGNGYLIGDGTLKTYETEVLEEKLPSLYSVKQNGYFRLGLPGH